MLAYINKVVIPHVVETRRTLKLPQSQSALALFDHFEGQLTPLVQDVWTPTTFLPWTYQRTALTVCSLWAPALRSHFKDHMKTSFQFSFQCSLDYGCICPRARQA